MLVSEQFPQRIDSPLDLNLSRFVLKRCCERFERCEVRSQSTSQAADFRRRIDYRARDSGPLQVLFVLFSRCFVRPVRKVRPCFPIRKRRGLGLQAPLLLCIGMQWLA